MLGFNKRLNSTFPFYPINSVKKSLISEISSDDPNSFPVNHLFSLEAKNGTHASTIPPGEKIPPERTIPSERFRQDNSNGIKNPPEKKIPPEQKNSARSKKFRRSDSVRTIPPAKTKETRSVDGKQEKKEMMKSRKTSSAEKINQ